MSIEDQNMQKMYEQFYSAVERSEVYSTYCREVFGKDFSQDGFSDVSEIDAIIKTANITAGCRVLDMGCGNGKTCEYIHEKTGVASYGFDYSENAIGFAKAKAGDRPLFYKVALLDEACYDESMFDAVLSVDTMYFVDDPEALAANVMRWLKRGGVFAVMYSSFPGEPIKRDETQWTEVLRNSGLTYEAHDFTESFYRLMLRKRKTAEKLKDGFESDGLTSFYERILDESIDRDMSFEAFKEQFSRFLYVVKKAD